MKKLMIICLAGTLVSLFVAVYYLGRISGLQTAYEMMLVDAEDAKPSHLSHVSQADWESRTKNADGTWVVGEGTNCLTLGGFPDLYPSNHGGVK